MDPAPIQPRGLDAPEFVDGLGERVTRADAATADSVEILRLRSALTTVPSFEFALRERAARLANFRHTSFARVRRIDRVSTGGLAVVSDHVAGFRLSQMLYIAAARQIVVDTNAALCLIRQLLPAIALLHENARDVAHGALGPERLIVTPHARLVVAEYVLGSALEQLQLTHDRLWKEYGIAMPPSAGAPRFDHRADVTQIGVTSLALILGRPLRADDLARIHELLAESTETTAGGARQPLSQGLRGWLARALQLDTRRPFLVARDAQVALDQIIGSDSGYVASTVAVEAFISRCVDSVISVPLAIDAPAVPQPSQAASAPSAAAAAPAPPAQPQRMVPPLPPVVSQPAPAEPPRAAAAPTMAPQPAIPPPPPRAMVAPEAPVLPPLPPLQPQTIVEPPAVEPLAASVLPEAPGTSSDDFDLGRLQASFVQRPGMFGTDAEEPMLDGAHQAGRSRRGSGRLRVLAVIVIFLGIAAGGVYAGRRYLAMAPATSTGVLVVDSAPRGVGVFVDGVQRGVTPLRLPVKPGAHIVELRGSGTPRVLPVTVAAGATLSQFVEFATAATPATGQLDVRSEPPGANITIDGQPVGVAPMLITNLSPGPHSVLLEREGATVQHSVTIDAGSTASLVAPVAAPAGPASGWIAIAAPFAMQVFEEGRLIGTTETDKIMVPAGRHTFEIVSEPLSYRETRVVQVQPGRTAPIGIELPNGMVNINAQPWAEVWIDNRPVGETPIGNLSLPIGPHEVLFRHPEFGERRQAFSVTTGSPVRLSVDMRK